jgi:heme/copper-type cytochrome/quinol oxidase subunit 1
LYFPLTGSEYAATDAVSLGILALHLLGISSEAGAITFLATLQIVRSIYGSAAKLDLIS